MASSLPLPARIETERLVLRTWEAGDAPALREALVESVEHLLPWIPWATPHPPSAAEVGALVSGWVAERESGASFIYVISRRTDGRLVGGIGLYDRVGRGRLEIGYWIRRTEAGRGYATEAAGALSSVGLGVEGIAGIEIHLDPANTASRRVPEKLGYRLVEVRSDATGPDGSVTRRTAVFELPG